MLRLGGREGYPRIAPILLTTPALALIAFLFAGGLFVAAAQSVGYFEPTGESAFTLTHYRAVISGTEFLPSLLLTLWVSAASTVLSAAFAVTIALAVRRASESGLLP
ncbi:MAG: hypothetical protein H7Y20_14170, partial [Bryobacteraceae bacterium]|nr:hypothetical protein [Bryobacteraceae bacterium]